ncbi:MAG: glutamate synthase-related protein [Microthrixaceae bacterium]
MQAQRAAITAQYGPAIGAVVGGATTLALAIWVHWAWWIVAAPLLGLVVLAIFDFFQREHSVWRSYPILGHGRWLMEAVRPELQQYFIERDTDGLPFDRDTRSLVYERAKDTREDEPFGTQLDIYAEGHEYVEHSLAPLPPLDDLRVRVGGPDCTRPYDMSLFNISAMSFGSLSGNAISALSRGAAAGRFLHDTGEGGLTRYHLDGGADLSWEIGSGYYGCRTATGSFDPEQFAAKAAHPQVVASCIKLSQGAKPGRGGVMPAAKVTDEIAEIRGVPVGVKCESPAAHTAFSTPLGLVEFVAQLRELSDGKPVGFKLCVGRRREFLAICQAMLATGVTPDFIVVDGAEGGTGAAPLEFEDHVGTPLTEGLIFVHNALVGCGLRDRIKIGCSGKVATGFSIVARLAQGADFTYSARGMMFAVGCIQAMRCHNNTCPVGVATQDPARTRALVVGDKADRVAKFHANTVASALSLLAAMGLDGTERLGPHLLRRRVSPETTKTYDDLYHYLEPDQLLSLPPADWVDDWEAADPATFGP